MERLLQLWFCFFMFAVGLYVHKIGPCYVDHFNSWQSRVTIILLLFGFPVQQVLLGCSCEIVWFCFVCFAPGHYPCHEDLAAVLFLEFVACQNPWFHAFFQWCFSCCFLLWFLLIENMVHFRWKYPLYRFKSSRPIFTGFFLISESIWNSYFIL